jgi:hypothetical protein
MRTHEAQMPHASVIGWPLASVTLAKIETVQGLSNGKRRLPFRGAGGTGKEQARRQRPALRWIGEQFDETPVAGDVAKRHGTGIVSLDAGYKAVSYQAIS